MRSVAAAAVLLVVGLISSGCDDDRAPDQEKASRVDELDAHDGEVCPTGLPERADPGYGFGNEDAAHQVPSLAAPDQAWVCFYDPFEAGPGPGGSGHELGWQRNGLAREVPAADLARLHDLFERFETLDDEERICTYDLGPRWMLVYAVENDLTGVIVDDYGCHDVRLTDEPFVTPPGDATQTGTVSGVLEAPAELLELLKQVGEA
jgi:hypothetical protein